MNEFDPIRLHRENVRRLEGQPVIIVPGYPGSGASLLGNILLEAGLNYVDPYTERLDGGEARLARERNQYRSRISAYARKDGGLQCPRGAKSGPIFLKTHLHPHEFATIDPLGVVFLVRDPRDAVHSYYRWRLAFSEEGEFGTFADFLKRDGFNGVPPFTDWGQYAEGWWRNRLPGRHAVLLKFEDLKSDPARAISEALHLFGAEIEDAVLADAVEQSSFAKMRRHELEHAPDAGAGGMIMRRGQVGEWKEWWTEEYRRYFDDPTALAAARDLGYEL
jgi:hypothetical protein